jgi:hypothetical protein
VPLELILPEYEVITGESGMRCSGTKSRPRPEEDAPHRQKPWAQKGKRAGQRPIPFLTPVDSETAQAGVGQPMNGRQRSHFSGSPGAIPRIPHDLIGVD